MHTPRVVSTGLSFAGFAAVALCPGRGHAQATAAELSPGARVRVTASAPSRRFVGSLIGLQGDSLWVSVSRDTVGVPLASVRKLELSGGHRPNYLKGALIGGGAGLALGLGVATVFNGLASATCEGSCSQSDSPVIGGVIGAGVGAGIGALLASAFKGERWQPVVSGTSTVGLRLQF